MALTAPLHRWALAKTETRKSDLCGKKRVWGAFFFLSKKFLFIGESGVRLKQVSTFSPSGILPLAWVGVFCRFLVLVAV